MCGACVGGLPERQPPFIGGITFTQGYARIRYPNDTSGNPQQTSANLVEWYMPLEFTQTNGATIYYNIDHSVGIIQNDLTNCGSGDTACVDHVPDINRTCVANATGTFTGTTLNWDDCAPNPNGGNDWNFNSARAVAGAGCATGWSVFGNANTTSSLVPDTVKGDLYQTWNQNLKPFVFDGSDPLTATFTMDGIQIPNGTEQATYRLSIKSSTVFGAICGNTPGVDLICDIQP